MLFSLLVRHYILWHYLAAPKEILHVWKNFVWFTDRYFSLGELVRSYFSPWRRMTEARHKRFSFEDWMASFVMNTMSRIVGMIMRTALILVGTIGIVVLTVGVIILLCLWMFAPALIMLCLIFGTVLLFS